MTKTMLSEMEEKEDGLGRGGGGRGGDGSGRGGGRGGRVRFRRLWERLKTRGDEPVVPTAGQRVSWFHSDTEQASGINTVCGMHSDH